MSRPMRKLAGAALDEPASGRAWLRWLPLVAMIAAMALVLAMGWHKLVSLRSIVQHYDALQAHIARNLPHALLVYILVYIAYVSLSLPGGFVLTIAGGLLFGWPLAMPSALTGALIGATVVFLVARTSLGAALAARAGPRLLALSQGFRDNALSFLLFLRLVPVFPFFLVNLAAGLLRVPLSTYLIATFFGTIPATTAFSIAGSGLGSVVAAQSAALKACVAQHPGASDAACPLAINAASLVTSELLLAFAALGMLALIPVALKRWSKRNASA